MSLITLQGCQWIMKTVNQALLANREPIDLKQAAAYAEDAEYQMSLGNPPCFEMKSWNTASGHTEEFEVPQRYVEGES